MFHISYFLSLTSYIFLGVFMSIRPATLADVPAMLAIYQPYVANTTYSFEYTGPTEAEFTERFLQYTVKYPWLVWEDPEDGVIGYTYASPMAVRASYQWTADVSIYIKEDFHGSGIGRALYTALENILRDLGYFNMLAIITEENAVSRAFHTSMGYEHQLDLPRVGYKFGRWLGVSYYVKRLAEGDPVSPPKHWKP